jgi:hypothetical protein
VIEQFDKQERRLFETAANASVPIEKSRLSTSLAQLQALEQSSRTRRTTTR